ncbi:MAG: hypothetical protein Q9220_002384 [cf. Caloplaca sp. 1 TL-2023]
MDRPKVPASKEYFGSLAEHKQGASELEVLLALGKAGPLIGDVGQAKKLLGQLSPYLSEAYAQSIRPSPFLRSVEPSPWEALTSTLTTALLSIGLRHPSLHDDVHDSLDRYLSNCLHAANLAPSPDLTDVDDDFLHAVGAESVVATATLSTSLLGFLGALPRYCHFYSVSQRIGLLEKLRKIVNEPFMISVEGTFSSLRGYDSAPKSLLAWRSYSRRYAACGRPLGAMLLRRGLIEVNLICSSLQIIGRQQLQEADTFDILLAKQSSFDPARDADSSLLTELITEIASQEIVLLEDGADYLQLGSVWQQRIAFSTKAYLVTAYLQCMIADEGIAEPEVLITWLEDIITDPVQMADNALASAVLKSMAVISSFFPSLATNFNRLLPRFIVQGSARGETVDVAARSLAHVLRQLSQDAVITGLYSLGNTLSTTRAEGANGSLGQANGSLKAQRTLGKYEQHTAASSISLDLSGEEETTAVHGNIVRAIVLVAQSCEDEKITALALSILLQKLGRINMAVDVHIIREAARLVADGGSLELKSLLKLYARIGHDGAVQRNNVLLAAVKGARMYLASTLQDSPLFSDYLVQLLETVLSKGDVHESERTHQTDVELAALEIAELLDPLATLIAGRGDKFDIYKDLETIRLQREVWYNLVVHDITPASKLGQRYAKTLQALAMETHPLIAEDRADQFESDIDLNTVLRRGMSPPHTAEQKSRLISILPTHESDIRGLSYSKVIFLQAAYQVETLRAQGGDCTHILTYFLDPSLTGSAMENCMVAIADEVLRIFLSRSLRGPQKTASAPFIAGQLAQILTGCCHRIPRVQQIASSCADKIIASMPSSLCQKSSLFALLELLSIMWMSCLDSEIDEYDWKSRYVSERGGVEAELSDDFELRQRTLNSFYTRARRWVLSVINIAPLDVKGLLQTYLAEYTDDGTYGHVSLGRSFAIEMGSVIPVTDQKLGAIDRHGECPLNTASDFVAQYTTRQEYRYADALPSQDREWGDLLHTNGSVLNGSSAFDKHGGTDEAVLANLEHRTKSNSFLSIGEMRDTLRRAAALLCKARTNQSSLVHQLVSVPFAMFTKQSIRLGISLWLGVINENPLMESRILVEVAEKWESSVRNRIGAFSSKLQHLDPFYLKEEFAPSDKASLAKRQQAVHNLIAPHLRILQFLASHFNATRLGSPHSQKIFQRLIVVSLEAQRYHAGHPLARELHFQLVLFGLHILRYSNGLDQTAQWKLKDTILSAALRWFSHQPRLQIKAESRLINDMEAALKAVTNIGIKGSGSLLPLSQKQELLHLLLENEQIRLVVWLFPLDHERRHMFSSGHTGKPPESQLLAHLNVAWREDPSLAIQLATRFQSLRLTNEVRRLLLLHPERAIAEPDALQILLGPSLPNDVNSQLKVLSCQLDNLHANGLQCLLYWAPVNPVTAATYFLPDYGNHPFILQYAMRALESHSIDVTFFYVPQIVQALRYDALGYVQRYIIETAKFSQLFAHQIIWNMKANAYKDEDSGIVGGATKTKKKIHPLIIT